MYTQFIVDHLHSCIIMPIDCHLYVTLIKSIKRDIVSILFVILYLFLFNSFVITTQLLLPTYAHTLSFTNYTLSHVLYQLF